MKRIIFAFFLMLLIPSNAFAQHEDIHENEYFKVNLPNCWEIQKDAITPPSWLIFSYDRTCKIHISPGLKDQQTIDEYANSIQEHLTSYNSQFHMEGSGIQLEASGKLEIDNHDARWALYSFTFMPTKDYRLVYTVFGDDYRYNISAEGTYSNLTNDRKIIEEIISSIKILK